LSARRRFPVWLRLLLAVALLGGVLWAVDLSAMLARLRQARPAWVLAALAGAVASNLVAAWRWGSLVRWLGHAMRLGPAVTVYFQAMVINALLPGAVVGGDVYRVAALRRRGMALLEAGVSVLLDRFNGLWVQTVLGLLALAWGLAAGTGPVRSALGALGLPAVSSAVLLALALLLLAAPVLMVLAAQRATAKGTTGRTRMVRTAALLYRPRWGREYLRQALSSAAVHTLSVAALACAGRALGLELSYGAYLVCAVPIFLMATLPIGYGGWGTREAAAALALGAFGVPASVGVAVAVLVGLLGLVQALAVAALLWLKPGRQAVQTSRGLPGQRP
jgi:uncharacterized membrane protein YbhN (UPF0104 family)